MRTLACCTLAAAAALVPTPVGKGPRYRPAAHGPGPRVVTCRLGDRLDAGSRVHLELFANRRVVIVPAAIGVVGPRVRLGRVTAATCHSSLWTLDPSGVVRFEGAATLADLFAVWGRTLTPRQLLSFRGDVATYVNGMPRLGDPRTLRLRDRDEIVLEVGGHVPPHRSFRFPP
jgi:hypothetical protein